MTGDNVTEQSKKETNKVIVNNLVSDIEKLLDGKATHYICSDLKTEHKKIVIVYDQKEKN